ncbi:MAG: hypothetical protein RL516_1798 [Bacteroidota bacterium]|jgi:hypothetical protein
MIKKITLLLFLILKIFTSHGQVLNYHGTEFYMSNDVPFCGNHNLYICGSDSSTINIYNSQDSLIRTFHKTINSCDTILIVFRQGTFIPNTHLQSQFLYKIIVTNPVSIYSTFYSGLGEHPFLVPVPESKYYGSSYILCGGKTFRNFQFDFSTAANIESLNSFDDTLSIYTLYPIPQLISPPIFKVFMPANFKISYLDEEFGYDLTGSIIQGSKNSKFRLRCGPGDAIGGCCEFGSFSSNNNYMIAKEFLKNEYFTVPYLTRKGDRYQAIPFEDSTFVQINNGPNILLNKGEKVDTVLNTPIKWLGNKKFALLQRSRSYVEDSVFNSNTFLTPVFPSTSLITHAYFTSIYLADSLMIQYGAKKHYLNLICRSQDTSSVKLDSTYVNHFSPFISDSTWCYTQIEITEGLHELTAPGGVLAQYYVYGPYYGYGYTITGDKVLDPSIQTYNEIREEDIKLFPNPTSGQFNVELYNSLQTIENLSIYNISGQIIYNSENINKNTISINLQKVQSGVYIIKLKINNNYHFKKLVIQF